MTVFTSAVLAAAISSVAGCGGGSSQAGPDKSVSVRRTVKVGIAYDVGGRGDKSFNDAAAAGLERAKTDLEVQAKELEAQQGEGAQDRYARLTLLCDAGYDLVIAVGAVNAGDPKTGPLARAAAHCPTTKFAIIDDASVSAPNLANLVFAEEQGSFLVGAAAALKTKSGQIGFIGGCALDTLRKFQAGYQAGARTIKPNIKIDVNYLSTLAGSCSGFNDPAKGKLTAAGMYNKGADIVFIAAGASGIGGFEAARAAKKWAIGVDSDQYLTVRTDLRETILTSMIKRVDVAVFNVVQQVADGKFKPGLTRFDLASNGVGYSSSGGKIDAIKPQLDRLKQQIISGKITVPTAP
jgi:basic membrane protein A